MSKKVLSFLAGLYPFLNNIYLLVVFSFFFVGCTNKPFQPIPEAYKIWSEGGQSEFEIRKALLECGYTSPFDFYATPFRFGKDAETINSKLNHNILILSDRCMMKAGFKPKGYRHKTHEHMCNDPRGAFCGTDKDGVLHCQPRPTACDLPWDQIPDRSIRKRLGSDFCKHYPKADVCVGGE